MPPPLLTTKHYIPPTRRELVAAAHWAEQAGLTPDDTPPHWLEPAYFVYVRLLLAQDRPGDAQTLLANLARAAEQGGRRRKLVTIYLQQARVHQVRGQRAAALERVAVALRTAAPQGYQRAFLDKGPEIVALLPALHAVAPRFVDQVLDAAGAAPAIPPGLAEPLNAREREILRLIAAGRSNPEIAEILYLSVNTVKWQAKNLYSKLDVGSRVEAVTRAQELGLLQDCKVSTPRCGARRARFNAKTQGRNGAKGKTSY